MIPHPNPIKPAMRYTNDSMTIMSVGMNIPVAMNTKRIGTDKINAVLTIMIINAETFEYN